MKTPQTAIIPIRQTRPRTSTCTRRRRISCPPPPTRSAGSSSRFTRRPASRPVPAIASLSCTMTPPGRIMLKAMAFPLPGFAGFVPFTDLRRVGVPRTPGVYVVIRPASTPPTFLVANPAGWLLGDPTVAQTVLHSRWVPGEPVIYIGKATDLRARLYLYRRHGQGKPVRHWGGRLIWQLADSAELLVAWKPVPDPRTVEKTMISEFEMRHGNLPFANHVH